MFTKEEKIKFVENGKKELGKYKLIGIVPLSSIPDRLLQANRNKLKKDVKFVIGRKNLLVKILESKAETKGLAADITGTSAIVLSNLGPFELYKSFKSNAIKLAAKPKQVAKEDIMVNGGETSLQPGQAVTELKKAGIDVQIQKGKVIISKDKVIVPKGGIISISAAGALHTLGITPFTAYIEPALFLFEGGRFTKDILDIDPVKTAAEFSRAFNAALTIAIKIEMPTVYTIRQLITKHYNNGIALGTEINAYDTGISDKLLAKAFASASALNNVVEKK